VMRIRDSYAWIIVLLAPFFFMSTAFAGWIDQCDGNGGGTTQNSVLDRCPSGIGGYLRAPAGAVFCTTNSSAAGYCYYGPAGKTTRQALDAGKLGCVDGGVGQNTCTRRTTDEADCINRVPNCSSSSSSSAPDAPSSLSAVAGNQKIDLSWNSVSGATSYQVMRRTSPGGTYSTVASNVTNTSYTNSGLTNGTTYYYIVRAKKAKLLSDDSPEASATPIAAKSIDYGPIVVNANINSKLDNRRERLIQFLGSDGKPVVASVDYVPNASYESIGVAYFPTGTTASFIRDVHPKTITSMQFTFADVELRRAMTAGIIKKNTGNITIKENGVVIKNIPISSPFITISPEEEGYNDFNYPPQFNTFWYPYSRDISIDFAGLGIVLKNDASYTISMDRGILKNSAQNDALSKAFTVSFKTGHPISFKLANMQAFIPTTFIKKI